MNDATYRQNLKELEKELNLPNPLIINEEGECSLLLQSPSRLWISIKYLPDSESVKLECILSHALPSHLRGLQSLMSKLVFDLIKPEPKIGKLIADPDHHTLSYISELKIEQGEDKKLTEVLPQFLNESKEWKEKLSKALEGQKKDFSFKEEEILNFNFQIS